MVKAPPRPAQSKCKQVVLVKAPPRPTQSKYKRAGGTGQGPTPRGLRKASACKRADGITSTCAEPSLYMCDIVRYHFAKAWLACARMRATHLSPGSRPLPTPALDQASRVTSGSRDASGCSSSWCFFCLLPRCSGLLPLAASPACSWLPAAPAPSCSRRLPIASGWCPVVFAASARPIPEAGHVHNFTPAWGAAVQMRCYGVEALRARCAICSDTCAKYAVDSQNIHSSHQGTRKTIALSAAY